jgi:hypothetical protein
MRNTTADRGGRGFVRRLAPLLLLGALAGCGPGEGTVSGQVKFKGKPLPGGRISFIPTDPRHPPATATLDENGRYQLTVAAGEVKISLDNRELAPLVNKGPTGLPQGLPGNIKLPRDVKAQAPPDQPQPQFEKLPGKYVEIPGKYYQIETSGLSYKVAPGAQTHDIELRAK